MTDYKHGASLRGGETTHSASKISDTDVAISRLSLLEPTSTTP